MVRSGTLVAVDGRPARRRVASGAGAAALRAERRLLERLAGLAVPEVLGAGDDGTTVTLLTSFHPEPPMLTVSVLASVASVMAAAHDRSVVHGALTPECIRASPTGAAVVDGWQDVGDAADDVSALGALLAGVATTFAQRAAAARATAPDPAARPTMAALAEALSPPLPARSLATRPRTVGVSRRRTVGAPTVAAAAAVVAVVVAVVAAVVGVVLLAGLHGSQRPSPRGANAAAVPVAGRRPVEGNLVDHDGELIRVGVPGDVVIVGDWDCDGVATPALLRRASHAIWSWATWDASPTPRRADPRAVSLRVVRSRSCERLVAVDQRGARVRQPSGRSRSATSLASRRP
ncbi:MAG: hypothetical protein JF603_09775 [Acidobacteria bacterium]|nr:hypothetical protein [Acidobacteriota bacterium]